MDEVELDYINVDDFSPQLNLGSLTTVRSVTGDVGRASTGTEDDYVVVEGNGSYTGKDKGDEYCSEGRAEREDVTVIDNAGDGEGKHRSSIGSGGQDEQQILARAENGERRRLVTQSVDEGKKVEQRSTSSDGGEDRCSSWGGERRDCIKPDGDKHTVSRPSTSQQSPKPMELVMKTSDEETSGTTSGLTDDEDDDDYSDSGVSNGSNREAHMSPDSEEGYDLVRTLRHYRRRRRRSSDSSTTDSNCSCESCVSRTNWSFFESEEGPPGGEATIYRRATIWLESFKYLLGAFLYGLLTFTVLLTGTVLWATGFLKDGECKDACTIYYWSTPLMVVMAVAVLVWHISRCILVKKGYGKGDPVIYRRNIIHYAQSKGLVYTIRGAIYAPTKPNPMSSRKRPLYEVVAYESEYDSSTYFDSDLEADGQYRRSITPWKEVADPATRERRNIYTHKAWFRDVPIIWCELWTEPPRVY